MYWKKKPTQSTNTANAYKPTSLKTEQGTLAPRYEMSNKKPSRPIPSPPTAIQTTDMEKEADENEYGPLYEATEPLDYDDMA